MFVNQCPDCGDDGLVVECAGWRELAFLAGRQLDPTILADGLRASRNPQVSSWSYVICVRCSLQGVQQHMHDTAQP